MYCRALVLFLLIGLTASQANANGLSHVNPIHSSLNAKALSQFSSEQRSQLNLLIKNDIRKDIEKNFDGRIIGQIKDVITGEPMSQETQDVIITGMIHSMQVPLTPYGIKIDEETFRRRISKILVWSSKYGLYPTSLAIGGLVHAQLGLGAAMGMEFDFYFENGNFKMTSYRLVGVEVGIAETLNMNFYAALCFGACAGGTDPGVFVGLDGMAAGVIGGGFYIEVAVDLTSMILAPFRGERYTVKDLYDSRAIYVGFGFDVGEGVGISGNAFYYSVDADTILVPKGRLIKPSDVSSLKLF